MLSQIEKQKLQAIKNNLPRGAMKQLADKHKVTASAITNVLNGRYNNEAILYDAIKLAEKSKIKKQELLNRLNALS